MQGTKPKSFPLPADLIHGTVNSSALQELLESILSAIGESQENYRSLSSSINSLSQQVATNSQEVADHAKQLATHKSTIKTQGTELRNSLSQLSAKVLSQEAVQKVMVGDM